VLTILDKYEICKKAEELFVGMRPGEFAPYSPGIAASPQLEICSYIHILYIMQCRTQLVTRVANLYIII